MKMTEDGSYVMEIMRKEVEWDTSHVECSECGKVFTLQEKLELF